MPAGERGGRAQAVATLVAVGLLWSTAGALIKYVTWPPAAIWGLHRVSAAANVSKLGKHIDRGRRLNMDR